MELEYIERLLEMFARTPVVELELSEDGWRIRLTKAEATPPPPVRTGPESVEALEVKQAAQDTHVIAAGLVGTFYRRPAPDKPPFVAVGDVVQDGQTLGIMEAMKMLIGIEADAAGRISEIFKEDGTSVQVGEPLFAIVRADRT